MKQRHRWHFYKPCLSMVILDLLSWFLTMLIVYIWRRATNHNIVHAYLLVSMCMMLLWFCVGYYCGKYIRPQGIRHTHSFLRIYFVGSLVFTVSFGVLLLFRNIGLSPNVAGLIALIAVFINVLALLTYYAFRYAINMDERDVVILPRIPKSVLYPAERLLPEDLEALRNSIYDYAGAEVLEWIDHTVCLDSTNTMVQAVARSFNVQSLPHYRYDCYVNLTALNNLRGINKYFCLVNEKLPDNGLFICCFTPQTEHKRYILNKYPKGFNYIIYTVDYIRKRVLPRILLTSRIYFDITHGRNRVFSQTEILGRLYYCGFEVLKEQMLHGQTYVLARRKNVPERQVHRVYGPLIMLNRVGKDGKHFKVYKMRTMHPYSEYLQGYMFEKYGLRSGGKIANDIRVSTVGAFMRKCWIDELPMFINLLRGEMKLVGVRPLSQHYFELYNKELQEKRIKFRPGLLPPFYADMPKTLEEIEASEMRYLIACEQKGCLLTDTRYFFLILKNILFKRARSH